MSRKITDQTSKCTCGAKYTSNPIYHLKYCDCLVTADDVKCVQVEIEYEENGYLKVTKGKNGYLKVTKR